MMNSIAEGSPSKRAIYLFIYFLKEQFKLMFANLIE